LLVFIRGRSIISSFLITNNHLPLLTRKKVDMLPL
jgi:hypothetical protein